ncbi:MAG: F0F1 ATP synthase subunit A [Candidatus Dojkabacteria bacterium]
MNNFSVDSDLPTVKADILFKIGDYPISNALLAGFLMTIIIAILCLFIFLFTKRTGTPSKFQIILEIIYSGFLDFVERITTSRKVAESILPIIGTVFIYIGFSNILTLLPGLDSLTYTLEDGTVVPLFRTHTSDFNTTFGIAASMILWTQFYSIQQVGIIKHFNKYFRIIDVVKGFRKGFGTGMISIIEFFVGLLDIISEFAKSISLSLRLFGNMFAGLMLSGIVLGALAIIAPVLLILFGLFSGVLQALVFGALTASYFGMAAAEEDQSAQAE